MPDSLTTDTPAWLPAVRDAARESALANDRKRQGWPEDDPRVPPFAYRWEHIQQVVRNGLWLLEHLSADRDVVLAACWLHDVKKSEREHARAGADFARAFLPTVGFPPEKVEGVAGAIAMQEWLWRASKEWERDQNLPFRPAPPMEPIEAAILWDADKLAKVGPIAFIHFLPGYIREQEAHREAATTESILTRNRDWLETITPRTIASFNTVAAQRRAMQLHAAHELFWRTAEEAVR